DHAASLRISDKRLKELQQQGVSFAREVARDMDGADAKRLAAIAAKEKAFIDDLNRYCIKFDIGSAEAAARVIKQCKAGDAVMCGLAANVADRREEALALAKRGCQKGDGLSCLSVAVAENGVRPGGPLTAAADKALRKVCEMGQADACAVLGMAY